MHFRRQVGAYLDSRRFGNGLRVLRIHLLPSRNREEPLERHPRYSETSPHHFQCTCRSFFAFPSITVYVKRLNGAACTCTKNKQGLGNIHIANRQTKKENIPCSNFSVHQSFTRAPQIGPMGTGPAARSRALAPTLKARAAAIVIKHQRLLLICVSTYSPRLPALACACQRE